MGRFFKILALTLVALLAGTGAVGIATTISPAFRERVELILNLKDENSIQFLKDKIKGYQSQVDDLNMQIKDLQNRVEELQESDTSLNAKIAELKARVSELESQVASLEKTISDLNLQVDTLIEQVDSMWNIFDNYQINDDYQSGATSEKPKLTPKEKEMVDDQVKKLESKIEDLTNQVKDLNNTINDLNSQIEDLKKDKSDAEDKKKKNDATIIEKRTEITNITTTINDYRTQIENNNQKYEDNRTQIQNNNVTINELEKKENKTEEEQNQLNSLKETNSKLETENTKIEEQRDVLQEQLNQCQEQVNQLNSQVTELENNNKIYTKQINDLDSQITAMESQVSEIQTSASTIQSNIDKAQAKANKFKSLISNAIIVKPSDPDTPTDPDKPGTTDPSEPTDPEPSEPDTPSDDTKVEYGTRYFKDLESFTTSEELDNYFAQHSEFVYNKTTDLSHSGILEQIPSAYFTSGGYKIEDEQNLELEKYIQFSYLFFKTEDKQKAIDYMKKSLVGMSEEEIAKYCNYYKVADNYIYLEGVSDGGSTSYNLHIGKRAISIVSYARKDGIFIEDNGKITKVYDFGRNWSFDVFDSVVFAFGENKGIVAIDLSINGFQVLTNAGTWNNFCGTDGNLTYIRNAEGTKQITYNLETNEFTISDYKEPEEPSVTTSKIFIDGEGYEFVVGSNFKDWLNSEYNTNKFLQVNNQFENFEKTKVLTLDDKVVNVSDLIIDGANYIFKEKKVEETTETTYTSGATKSNPDLGALSSKDSAIKYLSEKRKEDGTNDFTNIQSATSGYNLQNYTDCLVVANTSWGGYISIVYYSQENMQNVLNYIQKEMEGKDNCTIIYYYISANYAIVESISK